MLSPVEYVVKRRQAVTSTVSSEHLTGLKLWCFVSSGEALKPQRTKWGWKYFVTVTQVLFLALFPYALDCQNPDQTYQEYVLNRDVNPTQSRISCP